MLLREGQQSRGRIAERRRKNRHEGEAGLDRRGPKGEPPSRSTHLMTPFEPT